MNTNDKIQAVLATGKLGLPRRLAHQSVDTDVLSPGWHIAGEGLYDDEAYDLIAAHWARAKNWTVCIEPIASGVRDSMAMGDSEAAISAIYEALCGEATRD